MSRKRILHLQFFSLIGLACTAVGSGCDKVDMSTPAIETGDASVADSGKDDESSSGSAGKSNGGTGASGTPASSGSAGASGSSTSSGTGGGTSGTGGSAGEAGSSGTTAGMGGSEAGSGGSGEGGRASAGQGGTGSGGRGGRAGRGSAGEGGTGSGGRAGRGSAGEGGSGSGGRGGRGANAGRSGSGSGGQGGAAASSGAGAGGAAGSSGTGTGPRACGTRGGVQCSDDQFCNFEPDPACGTTDRGGACEDKPEACTDIYNPVCGCDDHTYSSDCFAHVAGVSVKSTGMCPSSSAGKTCGGIAALECDAGQFCNYEATAGGQGCDNQIADAAGKCEAIPDVCTQQSAPVCGCDHQTYGNICQAHVAGISVLHDGACDGDIASTPGDDRTGYVVCGSMSCDPGERCCSGASSSCDTAANCGAPTSLGATCDGPEDCSDGQKCLANKNGHSCGDQASSAQSYTVCHVSADCAGATCPGSGTQCLVCVPDSAGGGATCLGQ